MAESDKEYKTRVLRRQQFDVEQEQWKADYMETIAKRFPLEKDMEA